MKTDPNKRTLGYTFIQGTYWSAYAVAYSYASVFLLARGFSSTQVGIILALGNLFTLILQPVAASFLDKTKKVTVRQFLMGLAVAALFFAACLIFVPGPLLVIAAVFVLMVLSMVLMQSLISSLYFRYEAMGYKINFGLGRGIGSFSYAVMSTAMGFITDKWGEIFIPVAASVLILCYGLSIYFFKADRTVTQESVSERETDDEKPASFIGMFKRYPSFMLFVLGFIFVIFEHSSLNNFFIKVLGNVGGSSSDLGICIAIAAALELPVMAIYGKLSKRLNHSRILIFSAFAYILKATCTYFAASVGQIFLCQLLQIFTYALYSPAATYFANEVMRPCDKVKGQAYMLTSTISGGIIASAVSGVIIDNFGVKTMLITGIVSASIGFVIVFFALLKEARRKKLYTRV